jgi:hypothetical protein
MEFALPAISAQSQRFVCTHPRQRLPAEVYPPALAYLLYLSLANDDDPVSTLHRGQAVCNDQDSAPVHHTVKGLLNHGLQEESVADMLFQE